jgi:hypothetical protein
MCGVVTRKLSVTTNMPLAPRLPIADRRGDHRRSDEHAQDQLDDADHLRSMLHSERRVEPEEERAVAHHGLNTVGLGGRPLESPEEKKKEDERVAQNECADLP